MFIYIPTPAFASKLAKIEKHDPPGHARILDVIERLLNNPGDSDGWMHGEHHGRKEVRWTARLPPHIQLVRTLPQTGEEAGGEVQFLP